MDAVSVSVSLVVLPRTGRTSGRAPQPSAAAVRALCPASRPLPCPAAGGRGRRPVLCGCMRAATTGQ